MKAIVAGLMAFILVLPLVLAQPEPPEPPEPDMSEYTQPLDEAIGQVVPPVIDGLSEVSGQDLDREDVRILLNLSMARGDVDLLGMVAGSGRTQLTIELDAILEMRVLSTERIRKAIEGEDAYDLDAENATVLSTVYIPADVFRASLTAEVVAAFQADQQQAIEAFIRRSLPELRLEAIEFTWSNTSPTLVLQDEDLTEPPIVAALFVRLHYERTDSMGDLLAGYLEKKRADPDPRKEYIKRLKADAGDPLQSRDFFAAAAYTQMLNLTAQPGWSIDTNIHLLPGYDFTYTNRDVIYNEDGSISLHLDALDREDEDHKVFLASITHKRAVATSLFILMWAAALLVALPGRIWLGRRARRFG